MDIATVEPSAEPSQTIAETPINTAKRYFINSENGAALRIKAAEAKKRNELARKQRLAELEQQAELAKPLIRQAIATAALEPTDAYRLNRLARVRAQLALVDEQIETLIKSPKADQSRLKGLVEAQDRLSEQERKLDGRPLPGSHRPSRQKPTRASTGTGPVDAE